MSAIRCICPPDGGRHPEGDTVTFKTTLSFRDASLIRNNVRTLGSKRLERSAEIATALVEGYLLWGIDSWSLVDLKGKPIPVEPETVEEFLMPHLDVATALGDEADELFGEKVLLPLLTAASASSRPTPTAASTSATNGSRPGTSRPSRRSSTSTIPTDDTETTTPSRDGDSSSSRSLELVAG